MKNDLKELVVKDLFNGSTNYVIPIYQRNYSWGETEIGQLIQDVFDASQVKTGEGKTNAYYIGTLVVYERFSLGRIPEYEVIDGQQRLTTLALLLCALKHLPDPDKEVLEFFKDPSLLFDCRNSSTEVIKQIFDKEVVAGDSGKTFGLSQGYLLAKKLLQRIVKLPKSDNGQEEKESLMVQFTRFLSENVKILRVTVPADTDLNHYFEIMNSRGEQLEKHEILKAQLMEKIKDESQRNCFGIIWNACSDMDRYVQYGFKTEIRKNVFGDDWNELKQNDFDKLSDCLGGQSKSTNSVGGRSENDDGNDLLSLIEKEIRPAVSEGESDNEEGRFKSIVNFQNFLLHSLFVHVKSDGDLQQRPVPLDDKQLIETFRKVLLSDENNAEKRVKGFAYTLLKCRFLFDKYVVKRENEDRLSLRRLKIYSSSSKPISTFFDDENLSCSKESEAKHREIEMVLSMFHVSYPSMIYKYWLAGTLCYLNDHEGMDDNQEYVKISPDKYLEMLLKMAERFLKCRFLAQKERSYEDILSEMGVDLGACNLDWNKLDRGTSVENFVFNYLDYKLWLEDQKGKKRFSSFQFTIRSSVEHYYPQQPMGGIRELESGILNSFGNLCLISSSRNSQLSNMPPSAKKVYLENLSTESIKQRIMMDYSVWGEDQIKEHRKDMMEILVPGNKEA